MGLLHRFLQTDIAPDYQLQSSGASTSAATGTDPRLHVDFYMYVLCVGLCLCLCESLGVCVCVCVCVCV
jgi:hypothetical protein